MQGQNNQQNPADSELSNCYNHLTCVADQVKGDGGASWEDGGCGGNAGHWSWW